MQIKHSCISFNLRYRNPFYTNATIITIFVHLPFINITLKLIHASRRSLEQVKNDTTKMKISYVIGGMVRKFIIENINEKINNEISVHTNRLFTNCDTSG